MIRFFLICFLFTGIIQPIFSSISLTKKPIMKRLYSVAPNSVALMPRDKKQQKRLYSEKELKKLNLMPRTQRFFNESDEKEIKELIKIIEEFLTKFQEKIDLKLVVQKDQKGPDADYTLNYAEWITQIHTLESMLQEQNIVERINNLSEEAQKEIIEYSEGKNCARDNKVFKTIIPLGTILRTLVPNSKKQIVRQALLQFITDCVTLDFIPSYEEKELPLKVILALCKTTAFQLNGFSFFPEILDLIMKHRKFLVKTCAQELKLDSEKKLNFNDYSINLSHSPARPLYLDHSNPNKIAILNLENCGIKE